MGEGNLEGFVSAIRTVVRVFDERRRDQSIAAAAAARAPASRRSAVAVSRQGPRRRAERPALHRRLESQPHRRGDARRQADRDGRLGAAGRQRRHLLAGAFLSPAGARARHSATISSTSPTPRTTRSASSISRRARCIRWPAPASRPRGAAKAAMRFASI